MKLIACMLLLLIAATGAPAAQNPAATPSHTVSIWEVSGETNSVYLLGSIHLLRDVDYPLPDVINTVYDDAETLVMEVDMDDLDPMASQAAFMQYGMIQDEQTLADLMGSDRYTAALEAANAIDIPLHLLHSVEPWYAAMTIELMMLSRLGFNPQLGIEMHLMTKASKDNKPIEGFETIEEQLGFLDSMSLPAQRQMLLTTLTESGKLEATMDPLIEAWRNGDVAYMETTMLDAIEAQPELNKVLLIDRNRRWIEKIEPLLDDPQDYLIIVGVLHLIGEQGVPNLLRNRGIEIRQLSEGATVR